MALSDWLSADGQKAIEKIGFNSWVMGEAGFRRHLTLPIVRDRAREWLAGYDRKMWLEPIYPSGWMIKRLVASRTVELLDSRFEYDEALIAAILVTKEAGHDA